MSGREDFRYMRFKLPPEAFALRPEGPITPPRDIVEEKVWHEIVWTPDDVSIRTSDDFGTELKAMTQLWGSVVEMCNQNNDALFHAVLDIADSLQACIFNALCGFYRVAASCLRAGIEYSVAGTYLQMERNKADALRWQKGELEIKFYEACSKLNGNSKVKMLEDFLKKEMKYTIFQQGNKNKKIDAGWARDLFSELSNFVHGRPPYSEGALWEGSNGPVFIRSSFGRVYAHYLDVCALFYVLVKLCRSEIPLPSESHWLFKSRNIHPSKVSVYCFEYLWGRGKSN
jgi:hypothetical protein